MKEIHERSELKYELLMQKKCLLLYQIYVRSSPQAWACFGLVLFGCPRRLFLLKPAFIVYELEAE